MTEDQAVRRASTSLLLSASLFGVMALGARVVSARIPGPQIAFVRFAAGMLTVLGARWTIGISLRPTRWRWLVARGVAGGLAVLCYYSAIARIGAGLATLLNYTAPVFSLLLGWAMLGERPRRDAIIALALTLLGVGLVVGFDNLRTSTWAMVAVMSAVFSGVAVTSIRAARRPVAGGAPAESTWTVFASLSTVGALATIPSTFGPFGQWVAPTPREWTVLLFVAGSSIVAQLIMTAALKHVTAVGSGIIHQLTPIIALGGGVLWLHESLSARAALGCLVTLGGVAWTVLAAGRAGRVAQVARFGPR